MTIILKELLDSLYYNINELSLVVLNGKREVPAGLTTLHIKIEDDKYMATIPRGRKDICLFSFTLEGEDEGKVEINKHVLRNLYIPVLEDIYGDILRLGE